MQRVLISLDPHAQATTVMGRGLIRDVLTNTQPMILCGQPYATAALLGSLSYASLRHFGVPEVPSEVVACLAAFSLRASAIIFNIRMGPPGEFILLERQQPNSNTKGTNDGTSN